MRESIDVFEHAPQILRGLKGGVLLTAAADGKANPMTIGWGTLGIEWGKPVFVCYVRTGRYTHGLLDRAGEFTVNVPLAGAGAADEARVREVLSVCGTRSGRDMDKVSELGLTPVPGVDVSAPGFEELPLTLECRVLYRRNQDISLLPDDVRERCYPADAPSEAAGSNRDHHTEYYGEIVHAYILR